MNNPHARVVPVIGADRKYARTTGTTRPVRKGDIYLSTAIDVGFVAHDDSNGCYEILECFDCRRDRLSPSPEPVA